MQHINPKYFRAFKAVVQAGSFSEASDIAAMTQANVSKHIKSLEEQIGSELFVRTPHGPVITEAGERMEQYIKQMENLHADFMVDVNANTHLIEGVVSYAMPASCLLSPHFPMLLERRLDYPNLELKLELTPTDKVFQQILSGKIDFGFVSKRIDHPKLDYLSFCREEYVAVVRSQTDWSGLDKQSRLKDNYIHYPGFDVYFSYWINGYYPDMADTNAQSLHYSGNINSIEGAILMVLGGLGVSIFPRHCIQKHLDSGALTEYPSDATVLNDIYICSLKTEHRPHRVDLTISWFMDMVGKCSVN